MDETGLFGTGTRTFKTASPGENHASDPGRGACPELPGDDSPDRVEGGLPRGIWVVIARFAEVAGGGGGDREEYVRDPALAGWRSESVGDLRPQAGRAGRVPRPV